MPINKKQTTPKASAQSNKLWGGRFKQGSSDMMQQINTSIDYDKRLYHHDIKGSLAHVKMLTKQNIISQDNYQLIAQALQEIEHEIKTGHFDFKHVLEDIHMNIEARLIEKIGTPGAKLHTARSRNDQTVTDLRLWLRDHIDDLCLLIEQLMLDLCDVAIKHVATPMPGFTHLQIAQPVSFGHHMLAYVEMLSRDRERLLDARKRINQSPLGACALAGTSFDIDRHYCAELLGFEGPMRNSMDAVSARDFVLEALAAFSICAIHISRFGEEIVIWLSQPFNFITLSDLSTTGSSIMPQKRNPDMAELIRAKPGRILGAFITLATTLKALPMCYNKDMQEDKLPLFEACDALKLTIKAMNAIVKDMHINQKQMQDALKKGFVTATDLADWLVKEKGFAFRDAHHITGRIVRLAEQKSCALEALSLDELQSIEITIDNDIYPILSIQSALESRKSFGGTAPELVKSSALAWQKQLHKWTKTNAKS